MACACKVNQQLGYLRQKYGDKLPQSKKTNIRGTVDAVVKNALAYMLVIPLIPVFVIYAFVKAIKGEKISIDKFLRKKKNV